MNLQIMYFHFLCVLQSGEASFFISLSFFHSVSTQNIEKKSIAFDSSLTGQDLFQNFKMSFSDFCIILSQNTVL